MTSAALKLKNLSKVYAGGAGLKHADVEIPAGRFTSILGPSGCGKTTTLMVIAGIETPDTGSVWLGDTDITAVPLEKRGVGIVFQNYALFPNLTVRDNILYGLEGRATAIEKAERLKAMVALAHLEGLEDRYPQELSGGQQQRVAIARALAPKPSLLVLDEPLSALDAWTRTAIGSDLRAIQKESGVTTVMVTHDRHEALALSDFILVMNEGRIEQAGTPEAVYDMPATEFVATFVGGMNIVKRPDINGGRATGIRYGDVKVAGATESALSAPFTFVGQVKKTEFMGDTVRVVLLLNDYTTVITADVNRSEAVTPELAEKALLAVTLPEAAWRTWGAV